MGGTDLFDQYGSYYRTTLKSVKWHIRLFTHFFVAACINANILYQGKVAARNSDTQLKFMERIVEQWSGYEIEEQAEEEEVEEEVPPVIHICSKRTNYESRGYRDELIANWEKRLTGQHTVHHVPPTITKNKIKLENRMGCIVCRKGKTRHMCLECDVFCHISGETDDNCWYKLHSHRKF